MREALRPIQSHSMVRGGLPFHAALLERAGEGILVAGPSGTGKSTCCSRVPETWQALCDDEALIVRDEHGAYHCHPFPTWSDYLEERAENTWDVQRAVPLRAIFVLEQSDVDQASPLGKGVAATRLYEAAAQIMFRYWNYGTETDNRREKRLVFDNACELARQVPVFRLQAARDGRFWGEMERAIDS